MNTHSRSGNKPVIDEPLLCPDTRENNLPILRLLLAGVVVVTHAHVVLKGRLAGEDPLMILTNDQITAGTAAVCCFFILSGYLVTQSWEHSRGVFDYMRKRILRIYPGYLVAAALCFLLVGPLGTATSSLPLGDWKGYAAGVDWKVSLKEWLTLGEPYLPITLVDSHIPGCVNASLWSIRHEFACYLLVPFLAFAGFLSGRDGLLRLFILTYLLFGGQQMLGWELLPKGAFGGWLKEDMVLFLLSNFLAGMVFYCWRDRILRSRSVLLGCIMLLLAAAQWWRGFTWLLPTAGGYILFFIAFSSRFNFHHAFERVTKADFSYGLYLYHWPLQMLLVHFFAPSLNIWTLVLASMGGALLLAAASWYWVEYPALKLKQSSKRQPQAIYMSPSPPAQTASTTYGKLEGLHVRVRTSKLETSRIEEVRQ